MSESWMLDELAHARPEHLDEEFIAGYDMKQGYPDPEPDLAALRKKAAAADADNLEIVRAGFLSYTHAGPPADGVFTRNALLVRGSRHRPGLFRDCRAGIGAASGAIIR